jgi:ABC-type glycerol-3-phosphate transport system permease component
MTVTTAAARGVKTRRSRVRRIAPWVFWTLLAGLGSIIFVLPFVWMVSTAFKPRWEQLVMPPVWIPSRVEWSNFLSPVQTKPVLRWYGNTLTLVGFNVFGALLSSSLVAYGFARLQFRGRNILFMVLLATMMLPGQVTLIPTYYFFSRIHWTDSLRPLIVPAYFAAPFYVFLLRQFFMTVSLEMDEAAELDGCSIFDIYWRVILPMSKPALGVVAISEFTWNWNDFFGPLIYVNTPLKFPIAAGLRLFQTRSDPQIGQTMAMTFVSIIPLLIVFYSAQRYFIQGIVITGVKG